MKNKYVLIYAFFLVFAQYANAQQKKTDTNIVGHVVNNTGEHIPFATVAMIGTTIGTTTDETGHFQLINLPAGRFTIRAQYLGYQPQNVEIELKPGSTVEIKFILEPDLLGLAEVVVTGDRNETNRTGASTIVTRLTSKLFSITQSVTLSEGLNFCPGLRLENNCQNCGFTQVRMNGMEGPYSQILINSRPIFSGLAGVYGLELIPSNMIERVEVIRGGGSALYGSNAIAGTINLILKDPVSNSYEMGINTGLAGVVFSGSGSPALDYSIHANTSLVSADHKTGLAVYGFNRDRKPFDANNDGFSEISSLDNTTFGSRLYHRFGTRSRVAVDFFNIRENRRGGDVPDVLPHQSGITEAVNHNITTGAISYDQFFREKDLLSVFASGQKVNRDSYYGANQSLRDYGRTRDFSYSIGSQYDLTLYKSNLLIGWESTGARLTDTKMGYPDLDAIVINPDSTLSIPMVGNRTIADQESQTLGAFLQYELTFNRLRISAGGRLDSYKISDRQLEGAIKQGKVLSPRVTVKYDVLEFLQARVSYSQGYRAPQIFDEDLHIETSGARQVIHINDPELKQETSHSFMTSLDFSRQVDNGSFGLLVEGFYTRLNNAFANQFGEPDETGLVIFTRINAAGDAIVQGVNLEMNVIPSVKFSVKAGFTFQKSRYEQAREFNETRFFRTPDDYGFLTLDWRPDKSFGLSGTGSYTGKMLVPYFGPRAADPDQGELRASKRFFDLGIKVRYNIVLNGASLQIFGGMKNVLNSFQNDFDSGISRDPGFVFGPVNPRTVYFGLKLGNMLN